MTNRTEARRLLAGLLTAIGAMASFAIAAPSADAIVAGVPAQRTEGSNASFQRIESPRDDLHVCGATLIAPRWAVTAGHCTNWVDGRGNTSGTGAVRASLTGNPVGWRLRLGSLSTRSGGRVVAVEQFVRKSRRLGSADDVALLWLARPVGAAPARLATRRPAPGTQALILGWGYTGSARGWGDFANPASYPRALREATTRVRPGRACGLEPQESGLCVGGARGRPAPENMDSGGPVLAEQPGRGVVLAGTVNGGNYTGRPGPAVYTDLSAQLRWIRSYVSGRRAIPRDRPVEGPGLAGTAVVDRCSAAVVRVASSRPADHALLLTNGHCAEPRPPRGKAIGPRPARSVVTINGAAGNAIVRTSTTRLLYATMTGTDVAVYRLASTYAQLAGSGVRARSLAERGPAVGDRLSLLSGSAQTTFSCRAAAIVPILREGGYEQRDAIRYGRGAACEPQPGTSGSPLVDVRTGDVVAIHNTHVAGGGRRCSVDNPCEVDPSGTTTAVRRRGYAQQTAGLASCIAAGSRIDLATPGCRPPHRP